MMSWLTGGGWWLYLAAFLAGIVSAGLVTHELDANRYGAIIAQKDTKYAQDMKSVSDAATIAAQANQKKLQDQIDATQKQAEASYQELQNAKSDNDKLRADVSDGTQRLSIRATCHGSSDSVPKATASRSVDHATGRADINAEDGAALLAIVNSGDYAIRQLKACQDYVNTITR